jgi:hypothetical protein
MLLLQQKQFSHSPAFSQESWQVDILARVCCNVCVCMCVAANASTAPEWLRGIIHKNREQAKKRIEDETMTGVMMKTRVWRKSVTGGRKFKRTSVLRSLLGHTSVCKLQQLHEARRPTRTCPRTTHVLGGRQHYRRCREVMTGWASAS